MDDNSGEERRRFAGVRVLIFDLDGTLIDSKLDLAISVNATLKHMGREPLADETIFGYVGNGAQVLVQRALGEDVTPEQIEKGTRFFWRTIAHTCSTIRWRIPACARRSSC